MSCDEVLHPKDLIPVVSYFLLKGRCRRCKNSIEKQYPVVEILFGLLFVFLFAFHGSVFTSASMSLFLRDAIFVSILAVLFIYDLRWMVLPDRVTLPAMAIALILNLMAGVLPFWSLVVGAIVLAGFFYGQFAISGGTWVGGGDIRMGALMGFMLGIEYGLLALFIAYVLGAIAGVALIVIKKVNRKTPIPFGTFLTLSTFIVLFYGKELLTWYFGLFA